MKIIVNPKQMLMLLHALTIRLLQKGEKHQQYFCLNMEPNQGGGVNVPCILGSGTKNRKNGIFKFEKFICAE